MLEFLSSKANRMNAGLDSGPEQLDAKRARTGPQAAATDFLGPDQRRALDLALEGRNLFLTGGPGTGKSFALRAVSAALKRRHPAGVVSMAPTGIAAQNISGQTMHSMPGPGVVSGDTARFGAMLSKENAKLWRSTAVVVIDEISMVDGEFFEWFVEQIKQLNPNVQLILCGDFSQLAPIGERSPDSLNSPAYLGQCHESALGGNLSVPFGLKECTGRYAFETWWWRSLQLQTVHLTQVRRTSDTDLLDALADIREGKGETAAVKKLAAATGRELLPRDGVHPTKLHALRNDVSKENDAMLRELDPATRHDYAAIDSVEAAKDAPVGMSERLLLDPFFKRECQAPMELELRLFSQVMLLKNEPSYSGAPEQRLVNGSRGVVVRFEAVEGATDPVMWPVVRFLNGRTERIQPETFEKELARRGKCARTQVPLALAWAITVHKSQGMSIDFLRVDLAGTFAVGQAYTALSRATCLEGLQICNFHKRHVKTSHLVQRFNAALEAGKLDEFVATLPLWWQAITNHKERGWAELYRRNPAFQRWEREFHCAGLEQEMLDEIGNFE